MADLGTTDKRVLEKLLGMETGYVLDFTNHTFQAFVIDNVGIDIYDEKYNYASGSKANRLRAFWTVESDYLVARLLDNLLGYWQTSKLLYSEAIGQSEEALLQACRTIVARLMEGGPIEAIDAIQPLSDDRNFGLLAHSIRETISQGKPELGLDRLHTYTVKHIRQICQRRGIPYDDNVPLHALYGSYVKHLKNQGLVQSEMTERILKSAISILESFNHVRNRHSLAHDNPLLSREEAFLIFGYVASLIKFLNALESNLGSNVADHKSA